MPDMLRAMLEALFGPYHDAEAHAAYRERTDQRRDQIRGRIAAEHERLARIDAARHALPSPLLNAVLAERYACPAEREFLNRMGAPVPRDPETERCVAKVLGRMAPASNVITGKSAMLADPYLSPAEREFLEGSHAGRH